MSCLSFEIVIAIGIAAIVIAFHRSYMYKAKETKKSKREPHVRRNPYTLDFEVYYDDYEE